MAAYASRSTGTSVEVPVTISQGMPVAKAEQGGTFFTDVAVVI